MRIFTMTFCLRCLFKTTFSRLCDRKEQNKKITKKKPESDHAKAFNNLSNLYLY